jgi:hypothetical protein
LGAKQAREGSLDEQALPAARGGSGRARNALTLAAR